LSKNRSIKKLNRKIKNISNITKWAQKKMEESRRRRHKPTIKINVGFEYKKDR
jgi:hypothetical protein